MGETLGKKVTKNVALALQMTAAKGDVSLSHEVARLEGNDDLAKFMRRSTAHMRKRFVADNPTAAKSLLPEITPDDWRAAGQEDRARIKELTGA
jgi:hypothetical protein